MSVRLGISWLLAGAPLAYGGNQTLVKVVLPFGG